DSNISPTPSAFAAFAPITTQGRSSPGAGTSEHLRFGKLPRAVENFFARSIEAHHVIPAGKDRYAVRGLAIVSTELDSYRADGPLLRSRTKSLPPAPNRSSRRALSGRSSTGFSMDCLSS